MTRYFPALALAIALAAAASTPAFAQSPGQGGQMGMMGGGCPMMSGMMGRGMMGQGMMGQGMMGQGMMGQGMMGQGSGDQGAGPGMMGGPSRMAAMVDGRLAYLKSALDITDAQADAWNAYAEAVKARVADMQNMRQSMMVAMQSGSATERMDARISGMEAMIESMKAIKPATEELYGVLSDDQKKVADELIGMDCGAM